MRACVSVRRRLLFSLVLMIVLLGGAIMATTFIGARKAMRAMAETVIEQMQDHTEECLSHFFGGVITDLEVTRAWVESGWLDIDDAESLNRALIPLLAKRPQIASVMLADERGHEHMLLRVGDKWTNRRTRVDEWGARSQFLEWSDEQSDPITTWKELNYDPRDRPWFRGAVQDGERVLRSGGTQDPQHRIHWTKPYSFFSTSDPGITASMHFKTEAGGSRVLAFDVLANDISDYTRNLRVSDRGMAFVLMEEDYRVIGLPHHERFESAEACKEALLALPLDLGITMIQDAVDARQSLPADHLGPFTFISGGERWWSGSREFSLSPERKLISAIAVPQSDLMGDVHRRRTNIALITLVVLLITVWHAMGLARRFSTPIEALVRDSDRISRGNLDPSEPITSCLTEFRQLAHAHDRMRLGLQTLLKLESEIRLARQIQESTFPERLPNLSEYCIDAWSEPADETGGDTYDVVGFKVASTIELTADEPDRVLFLLADATGHGIGPALSVVQIRAMVRMAIRLSPGLENIARQMNEQLCDDLLAERFITAWLGELDVESHTLTSFSAGQGPLLRYDAERGEVCIHDADVVPFGFFPDLEIKLADPLPMKHGDIFAVISDGIFEARRGSDQFGVERTKDVIVKHHQESAADILSALRAAVAAFTDDAPADDDRTAILIKRTSS